MIAALPMYDRPETADATDRLWQGIAARLRAAGFDAPGRLTRGVDLWTVWTAPDLLLAQTCGLPFRAGLADRVTLLGTPDYRVEGCAAGQYRSVVIARSGEAPVDGMRLAYNDALSQSGWAAALDWAQEAGLRFGALLPTGGHAASLAAVAKGQADIAALDAVTWRLLQRHDPLAARVDVRAATRPTPGLPLITAPGHDPEPIRDAVAGAIAALSDPDRRTLGLHGLARFTVADYLRLPLPPSPEAYAQKNGV